MRTRLRTFFSGRVFEGRDPERQLHLLQRILVASSYLTLISIVSVFITGKAFLSSLALTGMIVILLLVALTLLQRGYVFAASLIFPTILWVIVTLLTYLSGGIRGPGFSSYLLVVLLAGFLLGQRAGIIFFIVSALTSFGILVLEIEGKLPLPIMLTTPVSGWIIQLVILAGVALLVLMANRNVTEALERAHQNETALAESNRELQSVRTSLEMHTHDLERRITQLQVASAVARDAASVGKVSELLNRAVNLVRDRFGFYHAGIFMIEERGEYAILQAATGEAGRQMLEAKHRLKVNEVGIVGYVTGTGQPRVALDVGTDAVYFQNPFLPETRSELALPLKTGSKIIGALDVQSKEAAAFDEDDVASLQIMADQMAVAIENARLYEAARRQVEELTILHAVATAGASATSQDILIERATQLIGETLYPAHFGVLLLDEAVGVLRIHPSYRGLTPEFKRLAIPVGRGVSGRVAVTGQPIRVSDVTHEKSYMDVHMGMRSELCVPLKIGERIIGVINAENSRSNGFTDADERLLSTFAGQLATAIEKVRLFEIERRRATELEALRQASLHLTSNLELKPVLDAILEHAIQLMSCDTAHLYLYDGENLTFGTALWLPGHEHRVYESPRPHGLSYTVARTGQRMVVPDVRQHPIFEDRRWDGAVVGLPLRRGDNVVGVMNLSFEGQPHEFDENEIRVLELLADQAAIAIGNARLYSEAQERAIELAKALEQREELDRLKNEFIQNVSHELRTPLAITRGYVELLDKGELGTLTNHQTDAVSIVSRRVNMLVKLVDDLITILEVEGREIKQESINLSELVTKVTQDFQAPALQAKLSLEAEVTPETVYVFGNPSHLNRLLDNLIGNAIKFTPPGGKVNLHLHTEGQSALLEVTDSGIGIPADKLDRIFDRFYQIDGSTTRRYGGTGLGLSLVKDIVQSHGGVVTVQSNMGKGSTFKVRLPLEQQPANAASGTSQT